MLGMASVLPESRRDWVQLAANGLWMGPTVIVCVLACRRLVGAFSDGMNDAAVCLVACGISAMVLLSVALGQLTQDEKCGVDEFRWRTALQLSPAIMIGWLLLVSPSEAAIAFLTVQVLMVAAIGWAVTKLGPDILADLGRVFSHNISLKHPMTEQPALKVVEDSISPSENQEQDELYHEMTRRHLFEDQTGWDVLQGVLTVDFQPNQRKVALHIPICPPMNQQPEVECAISGDGTIDVDVSSIHPYGVRLEVRRAVGDESARVRLEYTIASDLASTSKHVA